MMVPSLSSLSLNETGGKFEKELKERQEKLRRAAAARAKAEKAAQKKVTKPAAKPPKATPPKPAPVTPGAGPSSQPPPRELSEFEESPPRDVPPKSMEAILKEILERQQAELRQVQPTPPVAPPSPYIPGPEDEDSPYNPPREWTPTQKDDFWIKFQEQKEANRVAQEKREKKLEQRMAKIQEEVDEHRKKSGVMTLEEQKQAARDRRMRERKNLTPVKGPDAEDLEREMELFGFELPPPLMPRVRKNANVSAKSDAPH